MQVRDSLVANDSDYLHKSLSLDNVKLACRLVFQTQTSRLQYALMMFVQQECINKIV